MNIRLLFSIFCFFFNFFSLESASNVSVFNLCVCVCFYVACHFLYLNSSRKSAFQHECTIEKKLKLLKDNSPHIFPFLLLIYSCHKTETENDFTDYFLMFFLLHFSQVKNFFFFPFNCVVYKYNNSNSLKSYSLLTIRTFCFHPSPGDYF